MVEIAESPGLAEEEASRRVVLFRTPSEQTTESDALAVRLALDDSQAEYVGGAHAAESVGDARVEASVDADAMPMAMPQSLEI